jgi:hypothetical protein
LDPRVGLPAIQVFGLRKIGVTAEKHLGKAAAETDRHGAVDLGSRSFVRRSIGRTVDQTQHLAGVGQAHDQRVITPGAIVGNIHSLLALPGGLHQRAIHVDDGPLEKLGRLLGPDPRAHAMNDVLQLADGFLGEAAAEVARGGRVGDTLGSKGVEKVFILAPQFQVFQAGAIAQHVVSEDRDVIRLMIREVELEQMQTLVDVADESELLCQRVEDADSTRANSAGAVRDLIMNITGREHRTVRATQPRLVEAALDTALAVVQLLAYLRFHLKSLPFRADL